MNWVAGDLLETHTFTALFTGQSEGKLYFRLNGYYETYCMVFSPKIVKEMCDCDEWKQWKPNLVYKDAQYHHI